jgi:MFS family permease
MLGVYGIGFWIPKVLAFYGMGLHTLGWAAAVPYLVACIGMVLWSRSSDRRKERRLHLSGALATAAAGFLFAAFAPNAALAVTGFSFAALGVLSAMPVFWSASTIRLAGPMVGAHIAVINSIGNLGGFVSPVVMGRLRDATHSYVAGLATIAVCLACGAVVTAILCRPNAPEIPPHA